jgi:hypothetical protein
MFHIGATSAQIAILLGIAIKLARWEQEGMSPPDGDATAGR